MLLDASDRNVYYNAIHTLFVKSNCHTRLAPEFLVTLLSAKIETGRLDQDFRVTVALHL
jgi:hypothetical protein